jgi:ferredoxin
MLMSPVFPLTLQVLALVGVMGLAMNGLGIGSGMRADELLTLRKTNLTTLAIWGLWWPAMIAVALAFGCAWCTVCPMEMVNRAGHAIAGRIEWPRARLGKFLRAGWLIVTAYLVLQLLVAGLSIHRVPHSTAIFLLVLVGGALVTGLVFRDPRSFCRAFCPAGALLSVYGRYTPLQLEAGHPSVCDSCSTKDCVRAENRERFDKRSCPSLLAPFRRNASDGCVLCLQCAKVCPYGNIGWGLVSPEASVRRQSLLRPFEAVFVMVALGFVAHEVIGEVKWLDSFFHAVPDWLNRLSPAIPFGWFEGLWFLVLFPFGVWAFISGISYFMGHHGNIRTLLLAAATGAAPVVAVAHLAKAMAKVSAWSGFLPFAVRDPQGIETLQGIADRTLNAPASLLGLTMVGWAMLALSLVMAWKAWKWAHHVPAACLSAARAGLVSTTVLFGTILTIWAWPIS